MNNGTPVDHRCRGSEILSRAFTQLFQRAVHDFISIGIFALSVINHIQTIKQLIKLLIDFAECQCAVNAQFLWRGIGLSDDQTRSLPSGRERG